MSQESQVNHPEGSPKIILVDDDPMFGAMMLKQAEKTGISLDYYDSLSSLGFISQLAEYDIIMVDYQMDHINGIEIAAYMPSFFDDKTVILVSATAIEEQLEALPEYITAFIHKDHGHQALLEESLKVFADVHRKAS
ncbi:response regulator [Pseudobacteriovorax antillogorgiicola]|uniref:CheY chemotaxis protein or a CheY-like REC (Receiver) domain n=1 Tax=Pseudobacteriovorax antillogorgiicola TaxID=1513793 RepID=A0A1Y6C5W4_9BACT|nr:response regulator [Pseudobacteriovorax antillogorgiicola]TCS51280.1 CheY-like chemotaxis protein [Pseudobacteriovorax antillogorgiicola]SMF36228.1 CheY chemotaxis protein or a CheY-like REC (receiver) domain [Pseudobacteriovorax antillogorgiicola]